MEDLASTMSIVGWIIAGVALLIVGFNLLVCALKGFFKSLGRTAMIVLSFVVSLIVVNAVFSVNSSMIESIRQAMADNGMGDYTFIVGEAGCALVCSLIKPIAFAILFTVLNILLTIVWDIVGMFVAKIPVLFNNKLMKNKPLGLAVGLVNGLAIAIIITAPILGTLSVVNTVMEKMEAEDAAQEETVDVEVTKAAAYATLTAGVPTTGEVANTNNENGGDDVGNTVKSLSAISNNPVNKILFVVGGKAVYGMNAQASFGDGQKVYLEKEAGNIGEFAGVVVTLGDIDKIDANSIQKLKNCMSYIGVAEKGDKDSKKSALLTEIAASAFSEMGTKWSNGEKFLGIEPISLGNDDSLNAVVNALYGVFATTDFTNIEADMGSFVDILDVLSSNGVLSGEMDYESLTVAIGAILEKLDQNPRMAPVTVEVNNTIVKTVSRVIAIDAESLEKYHDLIDQIATEFSAIPASDIAARKAFVIEKLNEQLAANNVEGVADAVVEQAADAIATAFSDMQTVTFDDVKAYFQRNAGVVITEVIVEQQ